MYLNVKAAMYAAILVLALMTGSGYARKGNGPVGGDCLKFSPMSKSINDYYCDQPFFMNFVVKNEYTELLDNVCITYFPQPDGPNTYGGIVSNTYCDGSNEVTTLVGIETEQGVFMFANPGITYSYTLIGYAGCNTDVLYRCRVYGMSDDADPYVYGLSTDGRVLGLSCLRKIKEILTENNIPDIDLYVLPNKLPNRCVNQRQCFIPNTNNQFYKAVGLSGPVSYTV